MAAICASEAQKARPGSGLADLVGRHQEHAAHDAAGRDVSDIHVRSPDMAGGERVILLARDG